MQWMALLVLLFSFSSWGQTQILNGQVVGVTDGDTIKFLTDTQQQIKVRLYGIDAPEKAQGFGNQSKQKLSQLTFGKKIQLEVVDTDRYHRHVGILRINNQNINEKMIDSGLAHVYETYCKKDFCAKWKIKQDKAKQEKLGLWSQTSPIEPWNFRRAGRSIAAEKSAKSKPKVLKSSQPMSCCKVCKKGKACGDSCISRSKICHKPTGCACDS